MYVIDKLAPELLNTCVDGVLTNAYGLHYIKLVKGPKDATITFYWRPTGGEPLKIKDSKLENATVVGGETYRGKVFPHRWWWPWDAEIKDTLSVNLKRDNLNDSIRIQLTTDPQIRFVQPTIDAYPQNWDCSEVVKEKSDPITGKDYIYTESFNARDHFAHKKMWDGDIWVYSHTLSEPNAVIYAASCVLPDTSFTRPFTPEPTITDKGRTIAMGG